LKTNRKAVIFNMILSLATQTTMNADIFNAKPLVETKVSPTAVHPVPSTEDRHFVDFGKAAFGTVEFQATATGDNQTVMVHLGEVLSEDGSRIDPDPGGSRRYRVMQQPLKEGTHWYRVKVTPDKRNTGGAAIKMPADIGEVMPFRYCELEGYPGKLTAADIRQVRVHYPFNDEAASFECSDRVLNDVWELCKYSIKATSFTGIYVDGDRERIPYEGDAYINQLGHYCLDTEYGMARATLAYLLKRPTWPVEWHQHIPLMAWEEYLYTGDLSFFVDYYERIAAKLLQPLAREDGLLEVSSERMSAEFLSGISMTRDIRTLVDWPEGERDRHDIRPVDSVVNAFYYRGLRVMSRMARDAGKTEDADRFHREAERIYSVYQKIFFSPDDGIYRDGEGADHASLHANYFPLVSGLVPEAHVQSVLSFIQSKGMATSVYGAQHLIDGLFLNGAADHAIELLSGTGMRSWGHMIYGVGSTITLEAWDNRFKPNQDWNHAWGAAPANLIPRRLMGITPMEPGFRKARIQPQIGSLKYAKLRHPTLLGPIDLEVRQTGNGIDYRIALPPGMSAQLHLEGEAQPREIRASTERQEILVSPAAPDVPLRREGSSARGTT
jgi:alpha-L-rhamnosidase